MTEKYKLEIWKQKHKREYPNDKTGITKTGEKFFYSEKQRMVKRDSKGKFVKGQPVITKIQEKTYATGTYKIGYTNDGKKAFRQKIAPPKTEEWMKTRKEKLKNAQIYRCSLALNDIPYKGSEYYGFRIVAFSRNKSLLQKIYPQKMYKKLIEFIEKCLRYRSDEFWFQHYLNYMGKIAPELSNAYPSDSGKYELLWTKRKTGSILKQEHGEITQL